MGHVLSLGHVFLIGCVLSFTINYYLFFRGNLQLEEIFYRAQKAGGPKKVGPKKLCEKTGSKTLCEKAGPYRLSMLGCKKFLN
jgi:hypothetical protein